MSAQWSPYIPPRESLTDVASSPAMADLEKIKGSQDKILEKFQELAAGLSSRDAGALSRYATRVTDPKLKAKIEIVTKDLAAASSQVDLPLELWKRVFQLLPKEDRVKFPFVAKRFAKDSWASYVHSPDRTRQLPPDYLPKLLTFCGDLVTHLDFSMLKFEGDLQPLLKLCPRLQGVTFYKRSDLTLQDLMSLLEQMPTLKTVNVVACQKLDEEASLSPLPSKYKVGFVATQQERQFEKLLAAGMRLKDFFALDESREKVLASVDIICGLLKAGMDFEQFARLPYDQRERFYSNAQLVLNQLLFRDRIPITQICQIPAETLTLMDKNILNMSDLASKKLLKEFLDLAFVHQQRIAEESSFAKFFLAKDASLAAILELNENELKSDDLAAFICNHLDFKSYFQIERLTVLSFAKFLGPMMNAGMQLKEFLALKKGTQLQLVAAFNNLISEPEIRKALKEHPLEEILKLFHIQ